jgi:hypothetical protein
MAYPTRDYLTEYKLTFHTPKPIVIEDVYEEKDTRNYQGYLENLYSKMRDVIEKNGVSTKLEGFGPTYMYPDTKKEKLPYDINKISSVHTSVAFDRYTVDFEIFFKMKWHTSTEYSPVPRRFCGNEHYVYFLRGIPD